MKITRENLIEICDNFLDNKIDKIAVQDFAWNKITNDEFEWDEDEIVSDILFQWNNEEINFEINILNISLWKKRLLTEQDELHIYNSWNSHIETQKEICKKYNSEWMPINKKFKIGVSTNLDKDPINGLRHQNEKTTTGWFIWSGEYSEAEDFFQPICAEHLLAQRPEIIKYLGLEIGFRFLINRNKYEDVWYDEKLKSK
ncbi:hypothetical protein OX283_004720 [Flavobacterium sp. SUN052]|uniref:immunity protein Imm33 domain-containing protein n=1 Tax=Flavobacterium sp. SUN052 TaxID=3002441 RepID=UPI00237DF518|nr:hypothetical protein [Flavobacterium sp. SUN052]MEC4003949.1 hypothetical protein [Flavobacterium sp. SUN052]